MWSNNYFISESLCEIHSPYCATPNNNLLSTLDPHQSHADNILGHASANWFYDKPGQCLSDRTKQHNGKPMAPYSGNLYDHPTFLYAKPCTPVHMHNIYHQTSCAISRKSLGISSALAISTHLTKT